MPSERPNASPFPRGGWWVWFTSQQLGILCGLSTVALLAIGSIVLTLTRDGASAAVGMDDVREFFRHPSSVHLWFYLLCVVLTVYALNTLLATWQSVSRKWQFGIRAPSLYAAAVIHVAFLVALLAHLVGGLAGAERGQVVVGPTWTALGDGREARVIDLDVSQHADGSTRQAWATMEVRTAGQPAERIVVRYNGPLSGGLGSDLFLLMRHAALPVATLVRGDATCLVAQDDHCTLGDAEVTLLHLEAAGAGATALARVQVQRAGKPTPQAFWLFQGRPQALDDGTELRLAAIERKPAVLLRHRWAPGNPLALVAAVLLTGGLLLMWRRLLPTAS